MKKGTVLLCADEQSLRNPACLGFEEVDPFSLSWIACESSAEKARARALADQGVGEVWVVSCDDMEAINLAAAIKSDDASKRVFLVADRQSGSFASRAATAGVDALLSQASFLRRFAQERAKRAHGAAANVRHCADFDSVVRASWDGDDACAGGAQADLKSFRGDLAPVFSGDCTDALDDSFIGVDRAYQAKGSPTKEGRGTLVVMAGGSGGCGKSTIAALAALIAARAGLRTAVLDADLQFGDMDYLLGAQDPLHIEEVVDEPERLSELDMRDKGKLPALLAAPRRIEVSELVAREAPYIAAAMRDAFDVVVVNTGALWADVHAGMIEAADTVCFVMDSRPSSLRATVHAVELCARLGAATTSFSFVVNRHTKTSLLSAVDVSCALRGSHAFEFPDGGRDVDELMGAGYPGELIESGNAFVSAVRDALCEMLPPQRCETLRSRNDETRKKRGLFFGRGGRR
ncbi:MAG: hypothetical protein Q4B35_01720 [Slackia sp.]|nr:hypothetical protein [Slackia sp.]